MLISNFLRKFAHARDIFEVKEEYRNLFEWAGYLDFMKTPVVCVDRDGTVNRDDNYYLGSSENWKEQVELLEGVVEGITLLNNRSLPVFITTNQSGVALVGEKFDLLTEERMHEVNRYIVDLLESNGARVEECFACPYVDSAYVVKAVGRGRVVNSDYVRDDCEDLKPRTGMILKAVACLGKRLEDYAVFVIGDRKSDVEIGLDAGGIGNLVASGKTLELGDVEEVKSLAAAFPQRVHIAGDFLGAARYVAESLK